MDALISEHSASIVLVEDDGNDAFFVRHALDGARIVNPLVQFQTASDARRHFETVGAKEPPALCILDANLAAGESGIDFLSWLRRQSAPLSTTPVMMLTGSSSPQDREQAELLGAVHFLRKPVDEGKLTAAVQSLGFVVMSLTGFETRRVIERRG
jgi:CheY-like chemotaxis protein